MLTIAHRTVILSGQRLDLQSNFCAWMTLEDISGRPFSEAIAEFLGSRKLRATAHLLWALSASYRMQRGLSFPFTPSDIEAGLPAPGAFIDLIPMPSTPEWYQLHNVLGGILSEAGHLAPLDDGPLA